MVFARPRASPSIDGRLNHRLLHMQLETHFWGYWLVHIVVSPIGMQTPLAPWLLSLTPSFRGPVFHPIDDCEYPLLFLSDTGIASQEIAISWSCQLNLAGICNSLWVWWLYMGWIPGWGSLWIILFSVSALNFVSVTHPIGILFPILRRNEVSTLRSSFFLSFMCFANCILGIRNFWANTHLSVSVYHACSFVTWLPHSEWYSPDISVCLRILLIHCLLHCVNVPHFLYPFFCWGTSGFFPASGYYK
jgi:hypothetical protein